MFKVVDIAKDKHVGEIVWLMNPLDESTRWISGDELRNILYN